MQNRTPFELRSSDKTPSQFMEDLQRKGAKKLGSGAFSVVYTHPTKEGRVIKVEKQTDAAYVTWLGLVRQFNSPYMPIVYDAATHFCGEFTDDDGKKVQTYNVLELEALLGASDTPCSGEMGRIVSVVKEAMENGSSKARVDKIAAIAEPIRNSTEKWHIENLLEAVHEAAKKHRCDLHGHNWMGRRLVDQTTAGGVQAFHLVITDPVAF